MLAMTQALQGLASSELQFNRAAQKIAQLPVQVTKSGTGPVDQLDLSAEAVALIQSRNSFEANTKVIKVADEMQKTLLDAVG
jgi:flagellar hook-associated protein FlgK